MKIHRNSNRLLIWMTAGFFIFALQSGAHLAPTFDLESLSADFVSETKQIYLPKYPEAFNPSIIRWNGSLLLSFREIPDKKQSFNSLIGLVWLDEDFNPVGDAQILETKMFHSTIHPRAEDGRLIQIGDRLYLVYSDNKDPLISKGGFRVYIAELLYEETKFRLEHHECLSRYEGETPLLREKNWVPFAFENHLLLAYSIDPHRIFLPVLGTGSCETIAFTDQNLLWDWGELRGGTPALKIDDNRYLSFFHSCKKMATLHSEGKEMNHYFIGAYTFSGSPPFELTHISPEPIVGKNFYHGKEYKRIWGSVRVVFPCGFLFDDDYIWIAYGRQDYELWIAKLDKRKLLNSLLPLNNSSDSRLCGEI